jgi:hypothetical protein
LSLCGFASTNQNANFLDFSIDSTAPVKSIVPQVMRTAHIVGRNLRDVSIHLIQSALFLPPFLIPRGGLLGGAAQGGRLGILAQVLVEQRFVFGGFLPHRMLVIA